MKGCEVLRPMCSFGEEFRVESSVSWQAWGGHFDLVRNTAGYLHSQLQIYLFLLFFFFKHLAAPHGLRNLNSSLTRN